MKPKRCAYCKQMFEPFKPLQKCCDWECAHNYAVANRLKDEAQAEKEARKAIRVAKEKLKTRRDWLKETQVEFNKYIRARDEGKACISCGTSWISGDVGGSFDCGHYRSVGSAPHLRFDERNAHGQCKKCNRYGAGRAVDYRIGLIARIGVASVEAVERDNEPRRWSEADLKAIKAHYTQKRKDLIASRELEGIA
jgi:hypothetical protein